MSTSNTICNDGASKLSSSDDVCEMNDMLQQLSTADNDIVVSVCANCGKDNATNTCNKCKQVKYCNAACKKKHRSKHKKQCERRAAELHDEELFKQPPSKHGDCPICFERLPTLDAGRRYNACCGKIICSGCIHAPVYDNQGNKVDNEKCPFCRTPWATSNNEIMKRTNKRVEAGDAQAMYSLGYYYDKGMYGIQQNYTMALELYHQAAELGHTEAYTNIGRAYELGRGVEVDMTEIKHHYELAAIGGCVSRYYLGYMEGHAGNYDRALRHYMIAVGSGYKESLQTIQQLYSNGHVTKDDYTIALQLYQAYLGEIKSKQRDDAAAAREDYRYY